MMAMEVTVVPSADGPGLVATRWAQSPKLNGGWYLMFWTGIDEAHPGCSTWTMDPAAAARFDSVEELEAALATLIEPHVVAAPVQPGLW
jgi:hypothetical protein